MNGSHQRMVFAAVLGLAVVALLVDRLLLSGGSSPQAAVAEPGAVSPVVAADAAADSAAAGGDHVGDELLAERLARTARRHGLDMQQVPDAFRAAPQWLAPQVTVQTGDGQDAAAPDPVEAFAKQHRLTAVLQDSAGGRALVNGHAVSIGQIYDGFRLTGLTTRTARFEREGRTVELRIADDDKLRSRGP